MSYESRAICKYACRKNKPELLKEGDIKESAMVDVWLEVEAHQYTAALSPILFECLIHPMLGGATDQKVIDDNLVKIKNVLAVYEAHLSKSKYLAGDFLSLADLNHVSVTLCLAATPYASLFDAYPHPFGQVPALQDGDLYVFESRAICKYACRKNKPELLKEGDIKESAMVDVWLEVEAHQYTAALSPILFECLIHPMLGGATDQKVIDDNLVKIKNVLAVYEAHLSKSKYLAGDFLSLADLNHVSVTLCLAATPYASLFDAYPHVKAWWTDLLARPSVQKVAALMKP
uniref:glutathione transferase n=1 Tax=Triticum aestivum TaxID=4565 RepID=A0A077RV92_WHEAT|nr:unnamed protein product [Triticum aestivum]